jgi:hypothetical protein
VDTYNKGSSAGDTAGFPHSWLVGRHGKLTSGGRPSPPNFPFARDPRGIWLPTLDAFRTLAA